MGIVEDLLKEHGGELIGSLTGAGFSPEQAEGFLPPAATQVLDVVKGGGLDLGSLLGGGSDVGSLISKLDLPGLAARRAEIIPLFRHFVGEGAPPLTTEAAEALLRFDWPHNVRALKFAAERVKLFAADLPALPVELLPEDVRRGPTPTTVEKSTSESSPDGPPDRETLEGLLTVHTGNVAQVARALGKHRQQVYRWLRSHRLDPAAFRDADES